MAAPLPVKSFGSGMTESFNALIDNSLPIALGSTVGGCIGFIIAGTPMAWLSAKITSLVLGIIYAMGRPQYVGQPDLFSENNCHALGNIVASIGIPPLLVHGFHLLVI